jgi:ABC-type protease/lipase transport system fused ATPase/permease subunit
MAVIHHLVHYWFAVVAVAVAMVELVPLEAQATQELMRKAAEILEAVQQTARVVQRQAVQVEALLVVKMLFLSARAVVVRAVLVLMLV